MPFTAPMPGHDAMKERQVGTQGAMPHGAREHGWRGRALTIGAAGIVVTISAVMSVLNRQYTLDDALIYYRYVQNAIDGLGLVYNAGEYVNGLTSPLYTYLSLTFAFVIRDVELSQMFLAWILFTAAAVTVLFLRPGDGPPTPGAAFAAVGIVSMRYFYSVVGLETPLLLFLFVLAIALFLRGRTGAWMAVSALLLLTRGESLFLILLLVAAHLRMHRPLPGWRLWIIPVALLLAHYGFNLAYFGSPFPATLMAKIQQGESGLWETGRWGKHLIFLSVGYHFERYFAGNILLLAGPVVLALGGVVTGRREVLTQIIVAFLVLYTAFYIALSIPNYHWYYAAYYFFMFILAGGCMDALVKRIRQIGDPTPRLAAGAAVLLLAAALLAGQTSFSVRALPLARGYGSYTEIALWIKEHTPPDAKVAAAEIGHIGWYSSRYIIDILGLVSPPNAELIGQRRFDAWLQYYTPDYILVHDPLWKHEVSAEALVSKGTFADVPGFAFPGYRLLASAKPSLLNTRNPGTGGTP
jgi:hypothetical protein